MPRRFSPLTGRARLTARPRTRPAAGVGRFAVARAAGRFRARRLSDGDGLGVGVEDAKAQASWRRLATTVAAPVSPPEPGCRWRRRSRSSCGSAVTGMLVQGVQVRQVDARGVALHALEDRDLALRRRDVPLVVDVDGDADHAGGDEDDDEAGDHREPTAEAPAATRRGPLGCMRTLRARRRRSSASAAPALGDGAAEDRRLRDVGIGVGRIGDDAGDVVGAAGAQREVDQPVRGCCGSSPPQTRRRCRLR